jgi:hypothetical protein
MQQGRAQLDSDWNEQTALVNQLVQSLARDVFGAHGGPATELGFEITLDNKNIKIGKGRYYVDGILCENDGDCWYQRVPSDPQKPRQPHYDPPADEQIQDPGVGNLLVYLDVWERIVTYIDDPALLDPALGGVDTTARGQTVWQVRLREIDAGEAAKCDDLLKKLTDRAEDALLKARLYQGEASTDPCIQSPESRYRGAENQLYRVQVHTFTNDSKTFKWSRENGSVIYPIVAFRGEIATLANMGRYEPLQEGVWVEYVDDHFALGSAPGPMFQVVTVDPVEMKVTLKVAKSAPPFSFDADAHPFLRRWDQKANKKTALNDKGTVGFTPGEGETGWIDLEDGLQVQFQKDGDFRSGDYWLIPARVATGKIEWPEHADGKPKAVKPRGVTHHYAPLAMVEAGVVTPCRWKVTMDRKLAT